MVNKIDIVIVLKTYNITHEYLLHELFLKNQKTEFCTPFWIFYFALLIYIVLTGKNPINRQVYN